MLKSIFYKIMSDEQQMQKINSLKDKNQLYELFCKNGYTKSYNEFKKELDVFINSKDFKNLRNNNFEELSDEMLELVAGGWTSRQLVITAVASFALLGTALGIASTTLTKDNKNNTSISAKSDQDFSKKPNYNNENKNNNPEQPQNDNGGPNNQQTDNNQNNNRGFGAQRGRGSFGHQIGHRGFGPQRGGNNFQPGGNNFQPGSNNSQPGGNNFQPGSNNSQPGGNNFQPGGNNFQPGSNNSQPGGNNFQPGGNNFQPGGNNFQPGGNNFQPGGNNFQPGDNNNFNAFSNIISDNNFTINPNNVNDFNTDVRNLSDIELRKLISELDKQMYNYVKEKDHLGTISSSPEIIEDYNDLIKATEQASKELNGIINATSMEEKDYYQNEYKKQLIKIDIAKLQKQKHQQELSKKSTEYRETLKSIEKDRENEKNPEIKVKVLMEKMHLHQTNANRYTTLKSMAKSNSELFKNCDAAAKAETLAANALQNEIRAINEGNPKKTKDAQQTYKDATKNIETKRDKVKNSYDADNLKNEADLETEIQEYEALSQNLDEIISPYLAANNEFKNTLNQIYAEYAEELEELEQEVQELKEKRDDLISLPNSTKKNYYNEIQEVNQNIIESFKKINEIKKNRAAKITEAIKSKDNSPNNNTIIKAVQKFNINVDSENINQALQTRIDKAAFRITNMISNDNFDYNAVLQFHKFTLSNLPTTSAKQAYLKQLKTMINNNFDIEDSIDWYHYVKLFFLHAHENWNLVNKMNDNIDDDINELEEFVQKNDDYELKNYLNEMKDLSKNRVKNKAEADEEQQQQQQEQQEHKKELSSYNKGYFETYFGKNDKQNDVNNSMVNSSLDENINEDAYNQGCEQAKIDLAKQKGLLAGFSDYENHNESNDQNTDLSTEDELQAYQDSYNKAYNMLQSQEQEQEQTPTDEQSAEEQQTLTEEDFNSKLQKLQEKLATIEKNVPYLIEQKNKAARRELLEIKDLKAKEAQQDEKVASLLKKHKEENIAFEQESNRHLLTLLDQENRNSYIEKRQTEFNELNKKQKAELDELKTNHKNSLDQKRLNKLKDKIERKLVYKGGNMRILGRNPNFDNTANINTITEEKITIMGERLGAGLSKEVTIEHQLTDDEIFDRFVIAFNIESLVEGQEDQEVQEDQEDQEVQKTSLNYDDLKKFVNKNYKNKFNKFKKSFQQSYKENIKNRKKLEKQQLFKKVDETILSQNQQAVATNPIESSEKEALSITQKENIKHTAFENTKKQIENIDKKIESIHKELDSKIESLNNSLSQTNAKLLDTNDALENIENADSSDYKNKKQEKEKLIDKINDIEGKIRDTRDEMKEAISKLESQKKSILSKEVKKLSEELMKKTKSNVNENK